MYRIVLRCFFCIFGESRGQGLFMLIRFLTDKPQGISFHILSAMSLGPNDPHVASTSVFKLRIMKENVAQNALRILFLKRHHTLWYFTRNTVMKIGVS